MGGAIVPSIVLQIPISLKLTPFSALIFLSLLPLSAQDAAPAPEVIKEDFQKLSPGALPDELMVVDGAFSVVVEGENKLLQIGTEPLTEGAVLLGQEHEKWRHGESENQGY